MNLTFLPSSNVLTDSSSEMLADPQPRSSQSILHRVSWLSSLLTMAVIVGRDGNLNVAALLEPHIVAVIVS
jgi:hypothetical protein